MFIKSAVLALGVVSLASASPVKRQETTASVPPTASGTNVTNTVEATATSSVIESVSSAISSVLSSAATNTSTAPAPTSTSDSGNITFSGCPDGYSLTYVIGTAEYPDVELSALTGALEDWANTVPPPIEIVNSTGTGEVGAMRTWTALNLTVMEQLTNVTMDMATGSLNQVWNLTMPVTVTPSVVVSNATTDFTIYSNSTSNVTSAQFYVNFCVSDQQAGLGLYAQVVQAYLGGLPALLTESSGNTTAPASSSAASSAASATSSAASGASSVASGASSGVTGAVGTVSSAVGGAASTALSGVTGAAGTAISGASSVLGDVTGAILPSSSA